MNETDKYALTSILYGILALYCTLTRNFLFIIFSGVQFFYMGKYHQTFKTQGGNTK